MIMGKGNMGEFIKFLKEHIEHSHGKLIRSIPATKEQIEQQAELDRLIDEASKAASKHEAYHKKFWADIDISMDDYSHKHFNDKTKEIEIYGDADEADDDGNIPSPFAK